MFFNTFFTFLAYSSWNSKSLLVSPSSLRTSRERITRTSVPNEDGFKKCNTLKVEVAAIFS
jgi:hypothetical protein